MKEKRTVSINMFGGFSVSCGGTPVVLDYANTTKMIHLLICVLAAGKEGIPRKELISRLYGHDELEDPTVTLRVNAHRLRKYLKTKECFGDADCIKIKAGSYFWDREEQPVVLDTEVFLETAGLALKEMDEDEKIALLIKACHIYQGEFLPELAGEEWVAVSGMEYQKLYFDCLREAEALLKSRGRFEASRKEPAALRHLL